MAENPLIRQSSLAEPNWVRDIAALRDMIVGASRSHVVAAEAYRDGFAAAVGRDDGTVRQKILIARLAAESVSALEDLGALLSAVRNRRERGILPAYVGYPTYGPKKVYRRLDRSEPLIEVLRLPNRRTLAGVLQADDLAMATFDQAMANVAPVLKERAERYLSQAGLKLRTYNKVKHGFPVIIGLLALDPDSLPPESNWQQDANVITAVGDDGKIRYTAIERSVEGLGMHIANIKKCHVAWCETAALVVWLHDQGVHLG